MKLISFEVANRSSHNSRGILEVSYPHVAEVTKKSPDSPCLAVVVNVQSASILTSILVPAYRTRTFLSNQKRFVFLYVDSILAHIPFSLHHFDFIPHRWLRPMDSREFALACVAPRTKVDCKRPMSVLDFDQVKFLGVHYKIAARAFSFLRYWLGRLRHMKEHSCTFLTAKPSVSWFGARISRTEELSAELAISWCDRLIGRHRSSFIGAMFRAVALFTQRSGSFHFSTASEVN